LELEPTNVVTIIYDKMDHLKTIFPYLSQEQGG
jgi:hypothetical protein